jgi:hypothetical protein
MLASAERVQLFVDLWANDDAARRFLEHWQLYLLAGMRRDGLRWSIEACLLAEVAATLPSGRNRRAAR